MNIELKYGCNPHQVPASLELPEQAGFKVLNGTPSYINILDALGAWQLARELKAATGKPGAASFKHTSPAGAAVSGPLSAEYCASQFLTVGELSPVANAYIRARGGDRMCSFGDVAAVSDVVDVSLAKVLKTEVSDLIIAPGFEPEALEILKAKKGGGYLIFQIDPTYEAEGVEYRELFGFGLRQQRNTTKITEALFQNAVTTSKELSPEVLETLIVATIALKYTQSNSVCLALEGQVIGMGAGQQSRVHCTRLACDKAEKWLLQQHPKVLGLAFKDGLKKPEKANIVDQYLLWDQLSEPERAQMLSGLTRAPEPVSSQERLEWVQRFQGICLSSDAYIPFRDNIDRANRSNVQFVAHAGSSLRDEEVTVAAQQYGMTMYHTGLRLFLH
ncbi:phosphoribosylaminoimidazolecarboxamide formyltransferase [Trichlorobacter lovleyi]|uniref:Phosphoribosylaminoimidazolecarboxamide formyltransferase n=1 Tax=Trichlorobacter lovleyi (strain ATCC BAA-1151 / DSM 17278 / SZ) TaxID=398767 RepID=B3E9E2_TRIL1|nr:phosphoribosylaminoimidazolecarboxamide formyltransferase [Trichlorobacter lovleyi]ACD93808.1 Phosphoribosylaminoimidazolecarboxamide formyltransferase [Trichlorobacter lovleyi SZ]